MFGAGKTSLIVQAVVCLALIVWQGVNLVRGPLPSVTGVLFDLVIVVAALIGLAGAVYGLRGPARPPG
jgi:hypothetical protein